MGYLVLVFKAENGVKAIENRVSRSPGSRAFFFSIFLLLCSILADLWIEK